MPQGNLVEVLGREVRQGSRGELMVESTPSRQRRPPCKTNKEMSDEAADAAALTYLLTCNTPTPQIHAKYVPSPQYAPGPCVPVLDIDATPYAGGPCTLLATTMVHPVRYLSHHDPREPLS